MKVLVTGADGFIGSHLTELLVSKGYEVKALSQYNSFNNWGWLEHVNCKEDIELITGDIRDPYFCISICKDVETVFHLAALIGIPFSYISPDSYLETNVKGTLNMCEAARKSKIEKFIHTSTSEVYGTAKYVPINEDHPLQPQSPYSASKIAADAIAMSFYNSYGFPLAIARPFNTFGPRQSARAVIPTIITQIASGIETIKLGDTSPTRDFTYVEDICKGFLALAENKNSIGHTVNIGSNFEISILDVFLLIKDLMHSETDIFSEEIRVRPKKSEVKRLWCDNTKIEELTGFKPQIDIKEGLKRTIDWFTDVRNLKLFKTDIYNV
jgi:NAD dependent epimerase/dehydratase